MSPFHAVVVIGVVLVGTILVLVAGAVMRAAVAHHALSQELRRSARRVVVADGFVGLVPGNRLALVAGLRQPRTYMSADVISILTDPELAAVVAHERAHERQRGPLALTGLDGVERILGRLPPIGRRLAVARARLEIDADAAALAAGSSRRSIASAILKLAGSNVAGVAPGFGSVANLRLRALIDGKRRPAPRMIDDVVLGLGAALVACVVCVGLLP
jgi:beta-lactamase regulating signal transducer with metallopeptidase domain